MPPGNRFRHQSYTADPPAAPYELLCPAGQPEISSTSYRRQMQLVASGLRQAKVAAVYLVHGTLAGTDMLGWVAELERVLPTVAVSLRRQSKWLVDAVAGDMGNYSDAFAQELQHALDNHAGDRIPVRRYFWSSENHHVGRVDAAVRLIARLSAEDIPEGQRILLLGHSHAGNVLALLTNLLGSNVTVRQRFFRAARSLYRSPALKIVDVPVWQQVVELLQVDRNPLLQIHLDIVTFGTPIRYGWEARGYSKLMHFVHHRPVEGLPPYRAAFPLNIDQIRNATTGDFFQQFFIAGTNFPPNLIAWRSWLAEARLSRFLQPGMRRRNLWQRLKPGMRVPEEGTTLLVDYATVDPELGMQLAGHGVYTRRQWLLFHLQQIVRQFYDHTILEGQDR